MLKQPEIDGRIVVGAEAIGRVIGRSTKSAYHALESRQIPGARKVGGRWSLDTEKFFASFADAAA